MIRATAQRVWHWHGTPDSQWSRRITLAATMLFLLVVCRWRPWELFDRGGFSTDFYDAQAHAFLRGHLDVPAGIPGPEGFLIDGKTYLYYGPMLALLRVPFAVFGSWADGRLSRVSMVVAFFVACTATFHLGRRIGAMLGGGSPRRRALLVAAVACSPALSLAGWNSVYDETEMWALALFLATSVALLRLWASPSRSTLLPAVALACATVLTRSSVGLGALAAVGFTGCLLWRRHRRAAIAAGAGAVGGVLLNMAFNVAKFGTLLDLPADRQLLTLQNPARAAWFAGNNGSFFSFRFLPTTVVQYLRPDTVRFERLVPFVRFGPLATEYGSYPVEGNTPASSLTASATLLFVLALIGVVVIVRRRSWPLAALMAGALAAALPSFLIGFVANRYLTDMLPALVVPAAVTATVTTLPAGRAGMALRGLSVALVAWGIWVNVSLATWVQNLKEPGFTEMRYRIDDAVFGGPPPSVIDLASGAAVPRDGVVAIDGMCTGLYIAEQGNWVPLELAEGIRRVEGTADPAAGPVSFTTPQGDLRIEFSGGQATAGYQPNDGDAAVGSPVAIGGDQVRVVIESDPVTGHLSVGIDGRPALFAFAAPDLVDAVASPAFVLDPPRRSTPICDDLQVRR
ncbi:MAG: hypothetical protein WCC60_13625 [Ilumatobacteraceae bacterium]